MDQQKKDPLLNDPFSQKDQELFELNNAEPDDDGLIECSLLPLRDVVLYPNMVTPLLVGREKSLMAISDAADDKETMIAVPQLDPSEEFPTESDLYLVGTEVAVGRLLHMPDNSNSVLTQGRRRVEIIEFVQTEPYFRVKARPIPEDEEDSPETEALMRAVLALFEKCVQLNRSLPEEAYVYAMNVDSPSWLADLVASVLNLDLVERQTLLETFDPVVRLQRMSSLLGRELKVLELEDRIHSQVQKKVDKTQREFYLREQMTAIQSELGEGDIWAKEISEMRDAIIAAEMPEEVNKKALKELDRLSQMPPMAPEVAVIRTYLDCLVDLPWHDATEDNLDLQNAASVLDENHFGLPKAKDRILEHIAVQSLADEDSDVKQPILCFVGPPGTGKTSLGKSIAKALGRKFVRLSLGGVHDEAEIRGHRRTYIGSMPGRIIQTMRKAQTINPLMMLDEIDKLGNDFRGDPASALLEVLDPEQNDTFSDHYLELPFDLSKVMFITTANYLWNLPPALEDRLEVIEFSGYIETEKLEICRRFLIPRQLRQNSLKPDSLHFTDGALKRVIREYTYEAGVRNLDREIATIARKVARKIAEAKKAPSRITANMVPDYLGIPKLRDLEAERQDQIGVATGLAWTEGGGDLTIIEVSVMPGKGDFQITGQLGDVMQESVRAAQSYLRANAKKYGIKKKVFDAVDLHLHVPEGGIAKDGPSAGITIATALLSAYTDRKVNCSTVAMTGEITLRGRVLPIGGLKEKLLAAQRAGLKKVLIPEKNRPQLQDVPKQILRGLDVVLVNTFDEVVAHALQPVSPKQKKSKQPTPVDPPTSD